MTSQGRNETILRAISDGVIVVDHTQKIIFFNEMAEEITGWRAKDALSQPLKDVLRSQGNKTLLVADPKRCAGLNCVKSADDIIKEQITVTHKNGETIEVRAKTSPMPPDEKNLPSAVVVIADVTKEVQLQHAKDEFLSIAAHEVRTPLSAIKGNLEMVLAGEAGLLPSYLREYLDDALVASTRLVKLIRDILNINHLEQGKILFAEGRVDLWLLTENVLTELMILARQHGLKLVHNKDKEGDLPPVIGDSDKIHEVLINLVGNAIKFTPTGAVTVSHRVIGDFVETTVEDTGIGISKTDIGRLFKKFSQVGPVLNFKSGTGLGLYLSRQYIEKMDGTIHVESVLRHGSKFIFTLPTKKASAKKAIKGGI